ncbi:unnamed protein product [Caenorhabditis nigoni]
MAASETVQKEGEEPNRGTDEPAFRFNFFADLLHGIHFDWRKWPIDSGTNSLVEFIGGFEKWSELNDDCRMAVVKYLNYNDRCKLGICSKRDYETVKSTPLDVYSILIEKDSLFEYKNVSVTVTLLKDCSPFNQIILIFSQLGEDTQVRWYEDYIKIGRRDYVPWRRRIKDSHEQPRENRIMVLKSCIRTSLVHSELAVGGMVSTDYLNVGNMLWTTTLLSGQPNNYEEEAVKFAEKWMKKCNFELKRIYVRMRNYPIDKSQIKSLPKCKFVQFGADDVETFRWWIQKLPKQMENIQQVRLDGEQEVFTIPPDLLNSPQIVETSVFKFWCRAEFSDEQFLNLKANDFSFDCVSITDQGINMYIRKWVNGNGVPDFRSATLWKTEDRNFDELTHGLEYREWDSDFAIEEPDFCSIFRDCYEPRRCAQIYSKVDPYESITLSVASDCVLIHKTGYKVEDNGHLYSEYSLVC